MTSSLVRRPPRRFAAIAAAALIGWAGEAAAATDEQELAHAKSLMDATQYQDAAQRFSRLLDPASPTCQKGPDLSPQGCRLTDTTVVRTARGYYAIVLSALERPKDAKLQLEAILRESPTWSPSPAVYPPNVIDLYNDVKKAMEAEAAAKAGEEAKKRKAAEEARKKYDAWVDQIEKLAATETDFNSRWIAAIPFGVGQFQNDDVALGVFFASAEGSAVAVAIITGVLHMDLSAKGRAAESTDDGTSDPSGVEAEVETTTLNDQIFQLQLANNISMGVLGALIIAGIIEAEVNFVPQTTRPAKRPVPKRPPRPPSPSVNVTDVPGAPQATGLGLRVQF